MKERFISTPLRRAATSVAVILIAFVLFYLMLTPLLQMRERSDTDRAAEAVFPSAGGFYGLRQSYNNEIESVFAVTSDGEDGGVIGYLYNINENGLSGQLDFFVGLDTTGRVIGIYFPYFDEPVSYNDMDAVNAFLDSFKGKEGPFNGIENTATLPGEITVINGAEVTCYAIISGVNTCINSFFDSYGREADE